MGVVECDYCGTAFETRGVEGALKCPSCGGPLRLEGGVLRALEPIPERPTIPKVPESGDVPKLPAEERGGKP